MKHISEFQSIGKRIEVDKNHFINQELKPHGSTHFVCGTCGSRVSINISPYTFGLPFSEIHSSAFLSRERIIELKMATTASKWSLHLGELLVHDLPTLYAIVECEKCEANYLVVFGCGESQPGKIVCQISGVWELLS